jgi:hypothetical protein
VRAYESIDDWRPRPRNASGSGCFQRGAALTQTVDWADDHRDDLSPLEREFLEMSVETSEQEGREREAQQQRELHAA